MPETIKYIALQLEPIQGSYEASKFSHTFPEEKPFNYKVTELTYVYDVYIAKTRQYILSTA